MVEQMTVNHEDIGSSPIRGDTQICLITPTFLYGKWRSGSASVLGTEGQGFKSSLSDIFVKSL